MVTLTAGIMLLGCCILGSAINVAETVYEGVQRQKRFGWKD